VGDSSCLFGLSCVSALLLPHLKQRWEQQCVASTRTRGRPRSTEHNGVGPFTRESTTCRVTESRFTITSNATTFHSGRAHE
jgi:hypothetical protein